MWSSHLPAVRRVLLAERALAAEQACDEAAYEATGDRLLVAEAIVALEKLFSSPVAHVASGLMATSHFTASHVLERVQAMLDERRVSGRLPRSAWIALVLVFPLLAAAGAPLHHTTESLLGLIFH